MDKMDMLWSEEKLQKIFSKDSLPLMAAHASGDASDSIRCCRLCNGNENLHSFSDKCSWEGIEQRYDQLLYDCFGIRVVPIDCMICESCARQLRNAQRFHALIQAALRRPLSEFQSAHQSQLGSTYQSQLGVSEGFSNITTKHTLTHALLKKNTHTTITGANKRRKVNERKRALNTNTQVKRMNIYCTVCNHKYPMIVPFEGWKKFVCSRCKKNSEPRMINFRKYTKPLLIKPLPNKKENQKLQATDLKAKSRICSLPKNPSQITKEQSFLKPKYQCSQCSKKYSIAQHLNHHVESVHSNFKNINYICAVCGKDMNRKDLFEKHMRMHTGQPIYRCDVCMRVFKGKRTFQTHYLSHGK